MLWFFFFFYGCTSGMWKFLGQGLNLFLSCDLHHSAWRGLNSASTATQATAIRFLTHCATVGTPEMCWIFNKHPTHTKGDDNVVCFFEYKWSLLIAVMMIWYDVVYSSPSALLFPNLTTVVREFRVPPAWALHQACHRITKSRHLI